MSVIIFFFLVIMRIVFMTVITITAGILSVRLIDRKVPSRVPLLSSPRLPPSRRVSFSLSACT